MLTHSDILDRFHYSPETGELVFRRTESRKFKVGQRAGGVGSHGYRQLNIDGSRYLEHRIVWFYMTGQWPERLIDHADRNKENNRWDNLRLANHSQNRRNGRAKGYFEQRGKFHARVVEDGGIRYLGSFDTNEAAHRVFVEQVTAKHQDGFAYSLK